MTLVWVEGLLSIVLSRDEAGTSLAFTDGLPAPLASRKKASSISGVISGPTIRWTGSRYFGRAGLAAPGAPAEEWAGFRSSTRFSLSMATGQPALDVLC